MKGNPNGPSFSLTEVGLVYAEEVFFIGDKQLQGGAPANPALQRIAARWRIGRI